MKKENFNFWRSTICNFCRKGIRINSLLCYSYLKIVLNHDHAEKLLNHLVKIGIIICSNFLLSFRIVAPTCDLYKKSKPSQVICGLPCLLIWSLVLRRKGTLFLLGSTTPMESAADQISDKHQPKWEGKACAEVAGCKAEQVWPLLEDFFGLNKWFPTLTTCLPVEGVSGQPGCTRYCAGFKTHANSGDVIMNWTKQKLLSIDPDELTFSYSIIDGNVGFNSYVSTVKVLPTEEGCSIEWRYEVEPVEGWTLGDLDSFIGSGLQVMAKRMEAALKAGMNRISKFSLSFSPTRDIFSCFYSYTSLHLILFPCYCRCSSGRWSYSWGSSVSAHQSPMLTDSCMISGLAFWKYFPAFESRIGRSNSQQFSFRSFSLRVVLLGL